MTAVTVNRPPLLSSCNNTNTLLYVLNDVLTSLEQTDPIKILNKGQIPSFKMLENGCQRS